MMIGTNYLIFFDENMENLSENNFCLRQELIVSMQCNVMVQKN